MYQPQGIYDIAYNCQVEIDLYLSLDRATGAFERLTVSVRQM